jgi:hypothetical protein
MTVEPDRFAGNKGANTSASVRSYRTHFWIVAPSEHVDTVLCAFSRKFSVNRITGLNSAL